MGQANPKVDGFLRKSPQWREELAALRRVLLGTPLVEEVKWRQPCYTFDGKNVLILGRFKEWCGVTFFKGALMEDPAGILEPAGPHTQGVRVARMRGMEDARRVSRVLKEYVAAAIEVERRGLRVELKKIEEYPVPAEFQARLEGSKKLREAFEGLTPGRRRGYLMYFSGAKRAETRVARVERCVGRIMEGKGLEDE